MYETLSDMFIKVILLIIINPLGWEHLTLGARFI
jgi:hypothetical protein